MITAILQSAVILLQTVMVSLGTHLVKKLGSSFNQAV